MAAIGCEFYLRMLIISLPGEVRDRLTGVGHAKADK